MNLNFKALLLSAACLATLAPGTGLQARLRADAAAPAPAWEIPVICYHRFGPEKPRDAYLISAGRLDGEMAWLKKNGYQSVSLTQVAAALDGDAACLPPKPVVLSIDDGFDSGWKVAGPVFRKYGFHAVYFIIAGDVGARGKLGWGDLKEMERQGFEIGCHTWFHSNMAKPGSKESVAAYRRRVWKEVFLSKARLEAELGHPVPWLAYPYGAYNPFVEAALKQAGYKLAFTVTKGVNVPGEPPYRLKRIMLIGHPSLDFFARQLRELPMRVDLRGFSDGGTVDLGRPLRFRLKVLWPAGAEYLEAGIDGGRLGLKRGRDGWWRGTLSPSLKRSFHLFKLFASRGGRSFEQDFLFQAVRPEWKADFAPVDWKKWAHASE